MAYRINWRSRIPQVEAQIDQLTGMASRNSAYRMQQDMIDRVPVDTGSLQSTILVKRTNYVPGRYTWVVTIGNLKGGFFGRGADSKYGPKPKGSPVDYAEAVEYGTAHTRAQPFIHPAVERERSLVRQASAEELRRLK